MFISLVQEETIRRMQLSLEDLLNSVLLILPLQQLLQKEEERDTLLQISSMEFLFGAFRLMKM